MKYFFDKAKFLIIFFIVVSIMVILSISSLAYEFNMRKKNSDFLSNNYIKINASYSDSNYKINTGDVLDFLDSQNSDYLLYKNYDYIYGMGVYVKGETNFSPNIIEGRSFEKNDFKEKPQGILVGSDSINNCFVQDGKKYYNINNYIFEVIGIFENQNIIDESQTRLYINLNYDLQSPFMGIFYIDAGEHTNTLTEDLITYLGDADKEISIDISKPLSNDFLGLLTERGNLIFILTLTIGLLILNTFSSTINWVKSRNKELNIRRLLGANDFKIKVLLLKDYILIVSMSYIIGMLISLIIQQLNLLPYFGYASAHLLEMGLSYLLCLAIGLTTGYLMISHSLKKNINNFTR